MQESVSFRDFVMARSPALLRTAWLLTGNAHLAEDLLQTALARTWPQWGRLHPDGDPDAYVRRVMVNTSLSWRARRWHGEWATEHLPERAAVDVHDRVLDRAQLADVLRAVTPRQRAVLVLRFMEDCSEQQTADLLGCSVGTVKSHTSRALASLRAAARTTTNQQLTGEGRA
jgi:RNA polymerase sigma-70 factor (sigma-E family)